MVHDQERVQAMWPRARDTTNKPWVQDLQFPSVILSVSQELDIRNQGSEAHSIGMLAWLRYTMYSSAIGHNSKND